MHFHVDVSGAGAGARSPRSASCAGRRGRAVHLQAGERPDAEHPMNVATVDAIKRSVRSADRSRSAVSGSCSAATPVIAQLRPVRSSCCRSTHHGSVIHRRRCELPFAFKNPHTKPRDGPSRRTSRGRRLAACASSRRILRRLFEIQTVSGRSPPATSRAQDSRPAGIQSYFKASTPPTVITLLSLHFAADAPHRRDRSPLPTVAIQSTNRKYCRYHHTACRTAVRQRRRLAALRRICKRSSTGAQRRGRRASNRWRARQASRRSSLDGMTSTAASASPK